MISLSQFLIVDCLYNQLTRKKVVIASGDFNSIQIYPFLCLERVRELIWGLDYAMEGGEKTLRMGKLLKLAFLLFFWCFLTILHASFISMAHASASGGLSHLINDDESLGVWWGQENG